MDGLERVSNHEILAQKRLLNWLRGSDIETVVKIHAKRMQSIEDALFKVLESHDLSKATGVTLTYRGEHIGEDRPVSGPGSDNDEVYRALVYAKIGENTSPGRKMDLYGLLVVLKAASPRIKNIYPAAIQVSYETGTAVISGDLVLDVLERASQAIEIMITEYYAGSAFALAGGSSLDHGLGIGKLGKGF